MCLACTKSAVVAHKFCKPQGVKNGGRNRYDVYNTVCEQLRQTIQLKVFVTAFIYGSLAFVVVNHHDDTR